MKLSAHTFRCLNWMNLPAAVLLALLQRTPALRVLATAGDFVLRAPTASVLKSAVATLGALGAVHTLAGATTLSPSTPSPAAATVGTAKTIIFDVLGTQSNASSWTVGGTAPPGMSFNGGVTSGIINTPSGLLTLSGTPTTAGTYVVTMKAWENSNGKGNASPNFSYTVSVSAGANTAPNFSTQPSSQTVTAGANVTFTVAATGTPTPTLQWQKNGSPIAGQTSTSLALTNVQSTDAASYTCVATNSVTSVTSSTATLTVNAATVAPSFSTQPSSQTVTAGANVTFTVAATGTPTPTLQWQKNGSPIAGQTSTSLALTNVQSTDAASYTCVATNSVTSVTSSTATLTVNAATVAPSFSTQPSSQTVTAGANVTFTVAATGSPTPTLQWQKNGNPIAGQTSTSLALTNVQSTDAASYTCVATNSVTSVTSSTATLTVNAATVAPSFSTQPSSQTVTAGANVTFTVAATGSPTPTLQWQKNGSPIAGQTGTSLALTNVQSSDAASYTCVATNSVTSVTSSAAVLTLNAVAVPDVAPAFTTQPSAQTVTAGANVTFTAAATGSPTPTLQWRKNGSPLAGQTGSSLALTNVQSSDAASYTCVATNSVTSVTSSAAALSVSAVAVADVAPAFTSQPTSQSASTGGIAIFTLTASGSPTPTLQWQRNGAPLAGETAPSLTLTNLQSSDAASYTCVATNSAGSATSSAATLTVNAPSPTGPDSRVSNVSVRTTLAAAQTLIVGFTMQGGTKLVLLRAVGPGLANFGVAGAMDDPKLLLFKDSTLLTQNDDWGGGASLTSAFASVGAFPLTSTSRDAALMRNVEGGHTVQVSGSASGNVLVEAYDAGSGTDPRLTNVSARNAVGTGSDILIAGFTIAGSGTKNLLIRAVGPTLAAFGVPGTLTDPKLSIYNSAGVVIAENDNWNPALTAVFSSVGAFALTPGSKDSALTVSLPPGGYTVQVSGADGGSGEAIVELYELP